LLLWKRLLVPTLYSLFFSAIRNITLAIIDNKIYFYILLNPYFVEIQYIIRHQLNRKLVADQDYRLTA